MSFTKLAAASVGLLAVAGFALHIGCSSDPDPECSTDANCKSATTACTKGVCRDSKCVAEPLADGTRVADQGPVKDKACVKLECKGGAATEVNDPTKTPAAIPCQQQECVDMAPKSTPVGDGVPCMNGYCQAGVCVLDDGGPIGPKDTGMDTATTEVGDDAASDTEADAESDATTD